MSKALVIAMREYAAAVKTKSFLVSLILMPVLMIGGAVVQRATQDIADTTTQRVAIIDRTGANVGLALVDAANRRNESELNDASGRQVKPKFDVVVIEPAPLADKAAVDRQRLELSEQVRRNELLSFAEIGSQVVSLDAIRAAGRQLDATGGDMLRQQTTASPDAPRPSLADIPDEFIIRYSTNRPTYFIFHNWFDRIVRTEVLQRRAKQMNFDAALVLQMSEAPLRVERGLARQDATGAITYEGDKASQITGLLVPVALMMLMFVVIMVGASPLTMNVVEEKQQRIAEVLLASCRPFDIMLGKLLGGVATALTLAAIYLSGALLLAARFDAFQYISATVVVWFLVFVVLATLMYGSLFVVAGAAVTNIKESQSLITPVVLLIATPLFVFMQIVQYPNGNIAMFLSYFPLSAPLVTTIRLAVPPGIPTWQVLTAAGITLATTVVLVWMSGRIFRAALLMNSKPASLRDAVGWVLRG
jgi:ABC-2 type transport system permease protein